MKFDPGKHHRRSMRLNGHDYAAPGMYFVTLCTQNRRCLFGRVSNKKLVPNNAGIIVQKVWDELPVRFPNIEMDESIVMPNHLHGIIVIKYQEGSHRRRGDQIGMGDYMGMGDHEDRPNGDRPRGTLPGTLGRILQAFSSITTTKYSKGVRYFGWIPFSMHLWQRNYYDHIIRNTRDLHRIRKYIRSNPRKWKTDTHYRTIR